MYNLQSSPIFLMLPPLRFCLITESALNESLRMCSSSMNIRISQEDFVLKLEGDQEVSLRKGDWIALYPQILHMDPEVYEDPKVNAQLVPLFLLQAHCGSQAFCEGYFCCFFFFFFSCCSFLWNKSSDFQMYFWGPYRSKDSWPEERNMVMRLTATAFKGIDNCTLTTINFRLNVGFVCQWIIWYPRRAE